MLDKKMQSRVDRQASPQNPQSSTYNLFTERSIQAGYMGPELGRAQQERLQDQQIHYHPHPSPQPRLHPAPQPYEMHEAILREIERERIRDEIILEEIARRRVLEAEVRRQLIMERESALQRGSNGTFPFGSSQLMGLDSSLRLSLLGTRAEGRSLEERISLSKEERLNGRREGGGFEAPFQRGTAADLRVLEVKAVQEAAKKKENIILLAKPEVNECGSKRKSVTPPRVVDATELPPDEINKKKSKEDWSCALCQVSATSEKGLSEHLQGKKHKAREAALRAQRAGKNYRIGLFPKEDSESMEVVETMDPGTEDGVKIVAEEASLKRDDLPPIEGNTNSNDPKKESEIVQEKEKNGKSKDKKFRFWCDMCKVGTYSQIIMNAHEKGKKHVKRLWESEQNDKEVAENKKKSASGTIDEVLDEVRSEDAAAAALKPEDPEPVDERKSEDIGALEIVDPEHVDETKEENVMAVAVAVDINALHHH